MNQMGKDSMKKNFKRDIFPPPQNRVSKWMLTTREDAQLHDEFRKNTHENLVR